MIQFTDRSTDGLTVIELSGKIMGGPDAAQLNDRLHELLESGRIHIVADLSKVEWMNSSGLGILISGLTTIRNAGGDLKLAAVTDRIKSLLTITKLANVFDIHDTVEQARASFH
jgi:anti-sigma B factor antagonist